MVREQRRRASLVPNSRLPLSRHELLFPADIGFWRRPDERNAVSKRRAPAPASHDAGAAMPAVACTSARLRTETAPDKPKFDVTRHDRLRRFKRSSSGDPHGRAVTANMLPDGLQRRSHGCRYVQAFDCNTIERTSRSRFVAACRRLPRGCRAVAGPDFGCARLARWQLAHHDSEEVQAGLGCERRPGHGSDSVHHARRQAIRG